MPAAHRRHVVTRVRIRRLLRRHRVPGVRIDAAWVSASRAAGDLRADQAPPACRCTLAGRRLRGHGAHVVPMPPWPMSAIVSIGRGSSSGTAARRPSRTASVPAAKPVRSIDCAKIVNAS